MKYKKPEKDLSNLDRSEVFKIIHHMEREPNHGIQVRPPKVMAEEDVRNVRLKIRKCLLLLFFLIVIYSCKNTTSEPHQYRAYDWSEPSDDISYGWHKPFSHWFILHTISIQLF